MWGCCVDVSAKGRYSMILGGNLLKALGLNIKLFEHVIEAGDVPLKVSNLPTIDLGTYEFKV